MLKTIPIDDLTRSLQWHPPQVDIICPDCPFFKKSFYNNFFTLVYRQLTVRLKNAEQTPCHWTSFYPSGETKKKILRAIQVKSENMNVCLRGIQLYVSYFRSEDQLIDQEKDSSF